MKSWMTPGDFAIGSEVWPGLAKVVEECAEVSHIAACLMAFPDGNRPDGGPPLEDRLEKELGDLLGAIDYLVQHNPAVSLSVVQQRRSEKHLRFERWHREEKLAASEHDAERRQGEAPGEGQQDRPHEALKQ